MTDFSLFAPPLREAAAAKATTVAKVALSIGMSPRRCLDLEHRGLKAIDIERLAQLADRLDVSIDWLLGRDEKP